MMKKHLLLLFTLLLAGLTSMAQLVITEINYNDPSGGGTGDSLEYIEIYNSGTGSVDMTAYMLRSGLTFTFPSTILPASSYLVIARNMNAVQNFYGISGVLQWDAGQSLSNQGEAIVLADADTLTLDSVRFFNTTPWPAAANGTGASMMLCDPSLDNNTGVNWIAASPVNAQIFGLVNGITLFGTPGNGCIQNPPYVPVFATFPYTDSFDSTWIIGDGFRDVPNQHWKNTPVTGNASWRRNDDGISAAWTNAATGTYAPGGADGSLNSARFHSSGAGAGIQGSLDLYIDLSSPENKQLSFRMFNTNGGDSLAVWVSADNGLSFSFLQKFSTTAGWELKKIELGVVASATTIIRFRATGAAGNTTDIGLDQVRIQPALPDVGVSQITQPQSGCDIPANTDLILEISNFGFMAVDSIPVVTPNGTFYITDTLQPGSSILLNAGPVTIPSGTTWMLTAYTMLPLDSTFTNDTLHAAINNNAAINTFPFLETFETGNTVYFTLAANTNSLSSIESGIGQTGSTGVRLTGNQAGTWPGGSSTTTTPELAYSYTDHIASVSSSCMVDATSLTHPELSLDLRQTFSTGPAYCFFRVTINDTVVLTSVNGISAFNPVTQTNDPFVNQKFDLAAYAGTMFKVSFEASAKYNNATGQNGFGDNVILDNILIREKPAQDVGVIEIISPANGCGLGSNEDVVIKIKNFGTATANSFAATVTVGTGLSFPQFVGPILPGDTAVATFSGYDFSAIGPHEIVASTHLTGDLETFNDSLTKIVTNAPLVNTFPHLQDFESPLHGWSAVAVTGTNDWTEGMPAKANLNTTHSGMNCWVTGLTANYSNASESYVMSSCFDLTTTVNPVLSVWLNIRTQNNQDAMILEYTTDGVLWTKITGDAGFYNNNSNQGNLPAPKWSGISNGWTQYQTTIFDLAGLSDVKFRFRFVTNATTNNEGIAIDDFQIFEAQPELSISQVFSPVSGCNSATSEIVEVMVTNNGMATAYNPPVSYQVDNGTWVHETVNDSIPAGVDYLYTFSTQAAFSGAGAHTLTLVTALSADMDHTNDTLVMTINKLGNFSTPPAVVFDFETNVYADYLAFNAGANAAVFVDPAAGVMGGTGVVMTGKLAGTWPGGSSTSTTAAEAFSYTDHIGCIFTCDVYLPAGQLWALTLDLQQSYSTGPAYSWFRVMANNTVWVPEFFTGDTTFNPASENSDPFTNHLFYLSSFTSPLRLSLESSNKYDAANSQNGVGDNARVDNVGIIFLTGTPESVEIPLLVYPNPASDVLYLQYPELQENARLQLFTMEGQLLQEYDFSSTHQSVVDIHSLPNGVYTLRLVSETGTRTVRFVKNR